MMRELKATEAYQSVVADNSAAAQIPMMRELKVTAGGDGVCTMSLLQPKSL